MLREWINKVKGPKCIHKYNFIKTQDSENFKTGRIGTASFCKCGKEKIEYKYNSDINSDYWNI
ncbi:MULTISPECIES: hypothetical protein [Bacillus]|uniref:hypothetical protein n=1 Tax=Bacillus TaxID=1386 RepID=UPI00027CD6FF|nr:MULTISPECIES: hypothetical protein [Bacillus]AFQ13272.1 hypothetical protein BCK_27313 [Bacillus cereus FRI-35]ASZ16668.1 hypothetical protein CK938_08620 [Bacillus cereus]MCM0004582.1 hypothetical protein [Bacillus paranthracis]MCR6464979.1 hypothetical protein [Bacillus paranthracis]MCR9021481.1 hypothetical protein [Bacillus paranthracis]